MAAKRVKGLAAKARDSYRFGSEKPSSPDFGKSRKEWDAAQRAKRGKR
jgi:hypothetical protein